ncbi:MAG: flippase [Pseudobutyrivibrio sp.]|nr:flippase [Pseudobutyrivibrio sp.]
MKKSIKKNYIYNLSYQILILIVPLITTPYISRVLNEKGIGKVSFVESIVSYFILFGTPGVAILGQREVSYVQDDKKKRSETFWSIKTLELITSITALIVYVIFSRFQKNSNIFYAMTFTVLATVVDVSWFFQGMEEFGKIIFRNFIVKIANVIYIFTFIKGPDDTFKYALGLALFSFIANASLWGYLPKYIGLPEGKQIKPWRYLWPALLLFLPTIATKIYTVLDKTMIGVITKDEFQQNGFYELAMRASKVVLSVVTAIGTVMIPRIGYHYKRNEKDEIDSLMYKSYRAVMFLGIPLCLGLILVSDNFVPWFFGDKKAAVAVLLKILSLLMIAIGLSTVTGTQYMVPTQRQNHFTASVCIGAVVNFTLNIFLIARYQAVGAAVASVIAEFAVTMAQFVFVRDSIKFSKVLFNSWKYFLAGILMSVVLFFEGRVLAPKFINTLIMVLSGALTYGISLIMIRDSFTIELLTGVKNKVISKVKR